MHGGVKFYRGSPGAARTYVEADRSRADDYYLAEGTGLAQHIAATANERGTAETSRSERGEPTLVELEQHPDLDGDAYERWVAGHDVATGAAKGRLRQDPNALRFVEVVVNGPKSWSLAAALHPDIAAAYDSAQDRAATEIISWVTAHATTRVGPRGRQVQIPVEKLEAAVVRHHTSRAGDPHRHLHLQINARVYAAGRWRGLHSVGIVDSIEAINGIGHAAVMCDPDFRAALAAHNLTLDPATGEVAQLAPYVGAFSARTKQIARNVDRYEAAWRLDHPHESPGPTLRQAWDRGAWAQARPDKVTPRSGTDIRQRWIDELRDLGYTGQEVGGNSVPPARIQAQGVVGSPRGEIDDDAIATTVLNRLGARRSAWNAADIRGEVERLVAATDLIAVPAARRELAEHLTAQTIERCVPLLDRGDVPDHIRALTSPRVLAVEAGLEQRFATRAEGHVRSLRPDLIGPVVHHDLDPAPRQVVAALASHSPLLVIEGAAGAGKTTTLAAARTLLHMDGQNLLVVTPTLKAARVAEEQLGAAASSAAWLVHQYGFRWDDDGRWTTVPATPTRQAWLEPGDLLLVDEAGMLDQDTASALLRIADHTGARIAFVGDRHQLPAVGRGGVLDHATRWAHPADCLTLDAVHRFTDPTYADLTLQMRTGNEPAEVFETLLARGDIVIHPTEAARTAALTPLAATGGLVVADTREQVAHLNAAVRDHLDLSRAPNQPVLATTAGEHLGIGDQIATRHNDRDLGVANRDRWTITDIGPGGTLEITGARGARTLPAHYARAHVELAYATTIYGAQGETVDTAHLAVGDTTGAAAAYVAMTRGRRTNTAHLVADTTHDARAQWVAVFGRDRADLGPAHAARQANENIELYGATMPPEPSNPRPICRPDELPPLPADARSPGIGW